MDDVLISSKQVAAMIGISQYTFGDWRTEGKDVPPAYYINGRPRYRRTDVLAWIAAHPRSRE